MILFSFLLIKPRGGVASLLAQSDKKSFAELRTESASIFFFFLFYMKNQLPNL